MLKFENLCRKDGKKYILKDFSLELKKGEALGILGKSKSGKTEILDIIFGLKKPSSGKIKICDVNVEEDVLKARKMIGYTTAIDIYKNFTVEMFLKMISGKETNKEAKDEVLKIVNFNEDKTKKISELDEINKKRLTIASAFISNPEVVLLDNIFEGIEDKEKRKVIMDEILLVLKKNYITVISSTLPDALEDFCDKVVILTGDQEVVVDIKELKNKNKSLIEFYEEVLKENE